MATIKIYDGKAFTNVEVTDEFAAAYDELEHDERLTERKETRRHQSLDVLHESGFDISDPRVNIFESVVLNERIRKLYRAIEKLSPEQQTLLRQVYFEYIPQTEIAANQGVTKKAINNRLARILKKLKKFLS